MPHYDPYGIYNNDDENQVNNNDDENQVNNNESFTEDKKECKDKSSLFGCNKFANNYKKCFIDGKNETCCKTCGKFTKCIDNTIPDSYTGIIPDCNSMLNNPKYINENGHCNTLTWDTCCASCNNRKKFIDNKPSTSITSYSDMIPSTSITSYSDMIPSYSDMNPYYKNTTQTTTPTQTQTPTQTPTPPQTQTQTPQPYYTTQTPTQTQTPQTYYTTQTPETPPKIPYRSDKCNDNFPRCNDYLNECDDETLMGERLRKDFCCKTCSNLINKKKF